ncbi:MAG: phage major capsid protein [Gemmatimonadota bacterium]|nr:phage major capsid protein [Gemmatimonadota bacterium]
MARETFEDWIPVEVGSGVIEAVAQTSAIEAYGREETMASDEKDVPRSGDFDIATVAKGAPYGETTGTNDKVTLNARKMGGVARIAEEDLTDTTVGEATLLVKQRAAARNMAKFYDNAGLACSAASNGTTIPFSSLYYQLTNEDTSTGYGANDHVLTLTAANMTTGGTAAYTPFNNLLGLYEDSEWFDEMETLVIASPAFKKLFRGVLDENGRPIWVEGVSGNPDMLFGYQARWSMGARVSATATATPTGNPLMFVGNRQLLIKGMARLSPNITAGNPGYQLQRAGSGVGFLTDEALLKAAMRRGFNVGNPYGWAVLEYTG